MVFIDTHTHLYVKEFSPDIDEVIRKATEEGVELFLLPAIDSEETASMKDLENKYPDKCLSMAGLHPCSVKGNYAEELQHVQDLLQTRKFVAIGETGLDFYWDKTFTREQYESLKIHAEWALHYDLPLVLHTRDAMREAIDVISLYRGRGLRGVFHCFGGTLEEANDIISNNFLLGIGGVVTYKKSGLADLLKSVDLSHVVLETDAPYLAPVPYRGKRNESSYISIIAGKIAEAKDVNIEEVAEQTTKNAREMFKLNPA